MDTFQKQAQLDCKQYTQTNIKHYEILFGKTFVSTGGRATTEEFVKNLQICQRDKVLDIGSGIGGSAFYIAQNCDAHVLGVDLSQNMITNAKKYLAEMDANIKRNVQFEVGDIAQMKFDEGAFNIIYSRETIVYIEDKCALFAKLLKWLKPGGKLLLSEYCLGSNPEKSASFLEYLKDRSYHMVHVEEYGQLLQQMGFRDVQAEDKTRQCITILQSDLDRLLRDKHEILNTVTRWEYDDMVYAWELKLQRCKTGDQAWGLFIGTK